MLGNIIGGLIGAGASLLGGSNAQKSQERIARENIALQKEFAQTGIQWKVADAKAAGVHPLAALGATTHSFSPISVGSPEGAGISSAGQFLGRAIAATDTAGGRTTSVLEGLALERAGLENELLRSQIARVNQQVGPPMPSANRWLVDGQLQEMPGIAVSGSGGGRRGGGGLGVAELPGYPYAEPGAVPDIGFARTPSGYAPVPSEAAQERMEDMWPAQLAWMLRNNILPSIVPWMPGTARPPRELLPEGHEWHFNPFRQEWYAIPIDRNIPSHEGR